jgi:uncharacterized protein (TIGR00251 family)
MMVGRPNFWSLVLTTLSRFFATQRVYSQRAAMATDTLQLRQSGDQLLLDVHVVPRASRSAIAGIHDGKLKVTLDAPPVDGEANAALIAFLAKRLQVPKRDVTLVRGATNRQKTVALRGVAAERVLALISG